jgi:hypothetical protein
MSKSANRKMPTAETLRLIMLAMMQQLAARCRVMRRAHVDQARNSNIVMALSKQAGAVRANK